jgi:hypothetical protein
MGSGFRTFTAGEVLTASNVQNYLMDQSVMVFGGSAARSSAIGTANFEEGMVSYLTDTDKVEAYNGTDWVSVAPTTSQGLTLINTTSFSAVASQSVNDVFSATYTNYKILVPAVAAGNELQLRMRVAGTDESGSIYSFTSTFITSDSGTQSATIGELQSLINFQEFGNGSVSIEIFKPFLTEYTSMNWANAIGRTGGAGRNRTRTGTAIVGSSTSYTGFTLLTNSGTALTGSVSVYGYSL